MVNFTVVQRMHPINSYNHLDLMPTICASCRWLHKKQYVSKQDKLELNVVADFSLHLNWHLYVYLPVMLNALQSVEYRNSRTKYMQNCKFPKSLLLIYIIPEKYDYKLHILLLLRKSYCCE
ncbi:hypothetical protein T10_13176 [Trichinella papuae]|uniref:Uncharacterized protein n=1 Tax=Trichinella papuae TaxID=268474 RepID=A0A0V1N7H7_9BILA|nr:hypothetical protein T10_13176 [Trichinella papuae]